MKYKINNIDAWGNADDGWDQNDWFPVGEIDIPEDASDMDCLARLHGDGYLTALALETCELNHWDHENGSFDVCDRETGEPLLQLLAEDTES